MDKYITLDCGCIIKNNIVVTLCGYHYENQPCIKDPLDRHLKENNTKFTDETKQLKKFVKIEFFNDSKEDLIVRTTPQSSPDNPERIKPFGIETLYVKQEEGFMKLWTKLNHLLVI